MLTKRIWQSDRWFVLAVCFLVLNSWAVLRWVPNRAERVRVLSFVPDEDDAVEGTRPLRWTFSHPMATNTMPHRAVDLVTISPAVSGHCHWENARTLLFKPDQPWPLCTPFSAELNRSAIEDTRGLPVAEPRRFAFRSQPLRLRSVRQSDFSVDREITLRIEFNAPPLVRAVQDHVRIEDGRGRPVSYRVLTPAPSETVLLTTSPVLTDGLTVVVTPDLAPQNGLLATETETRFPIALACGLALQSVEPQSETFEDPFISAYFNAPLDIGQTHAYLQISPPVETVVTPLSSWRAAGCRITGPFRPGTTYTLTFKKGLPSAAGARLPSDVTRRVYAPERAPCIAFRTDGRYLSSRGNRSVPVTTVNVPAFSVTSERIYPNNLVYFAMRESDPHSGCFGGPPHDGLTHACARKRYTVDPRPNEAVVTPLRMTDLMGGNASGAYLLSAQSDRAGACQQLVVVTDIGITVKQSRGDLLVWANSIRTTEPVAGARVRVYSRANQEILGGTTDTNGVAHLCGALTKPDTQPFLVTVNTDEDASYLKLDGTKVDLAGEIDGREAPESAYDAYVFTDRGIYRPGETVHATVVLRSHTLACPEPFPLALRVLGPDGRPVRTLTGMPDRFGCAEYDVEWPAYAMTGRYRLEALVPGDDRVIGAAPLSVEEFVPPQIAVALKAPDGRHGQSIPFEVNARYLFGRPAAGLPVEAQAVIEPAPFTPTGWPGYAFGDPERGFGVAQQKIGVGRLDTDGSGRFTLEIPAGWQPPCALKVMLAACVTETSGRAVSAYLSRPVDVYRFYAGVFPERNRRWRVGETTTVHLAAVRPDGSAASDVDALDVEIARLSWVNLLQRRDDGSYVYRSEQRADVAQRKRVPLVGGKAALPVALATSGPHVLRAIGPDGGCAASVQIHAAAGEADSHPWAMDIPSAVALELDRPSYRPGETARLLVKSPFNGRALLSIESDRILHFHAFALTNNTLEIPISIGSNFVPNVYASVIVLRPARPEAAWGPHRATGVTPLAVTVPEERLRVAIESPPAIEPATTLTARVRVRDHAGHAVAARLSIAAVDEAICRLTSFATPDPLAHFRRKRRLGVDLHDLYSILMPEADASTSGFASEPGGSGPSPVAGRLNPVRARRFRPVALWQAAVTTDVNGEASVSLAVPEFTGELRLMAVAIEHGRFGSTQTPVTVKRPLVVIASLPRFLAPSDLCTMPIHVINESDRIQPITVFASYAGMLAGETCGEQARLAPGEERTFTLDVEASPVPGTGRLALSVQGQNIRYRDTFEIAVRPAAPRTIRSGSGLLQARESTVIPLPGGMLAGTAAHQVQCSGMPAVRLAASLDYLLRYPYGCIEQTTSGAFPLLYLADLLRSIRPEVAPRDATHFVLSGIHRVLSMQQFDGGFSYWPRSAEPYPWGSIYATHFLLEAKKAGYDVPAGPLDAALSYLERLLDARTESGPDAPSRQDDTCRRSYACHVLALAGRPPHGWIARLLESAPQLAAASRANLAAALIAGGRRPDAVELLNTAPLDRTVTDSPETDGCLNTATRDAAALLCAWLDADPRHPSVPERVAQLEAHARDGRWNTTQDNAMALLALGKYCRIRPAFPAQSTGTVAWVEAGDAHAWTANARTVTLDRAWQFQPRDCRAVAITNHGPGPLYFHWRSEGVPADGQVEEADRGMEVRRTLLDADGRPLDAERVEQGQLVVVDISIRAPGTVLRNVVVDDLLPAGLEVENARLDTAQVIPWARNVPALAVRHVDVRDDRVLLFVREVEGRRSFRYAARAVTPGEYVCPPVQAECMYDPNVRSVHGRHRLLVVAMEPDPVPKAP